MQPHARRLGYHPAYYVPSEQSVADVHMVQEKHVAEVVGAIGGESARRLGFDHMSANRELERWRSKHEVQLESLEQGLACKKQGLDYMRRHFVPHTRLYDVADYYYKVWRTLSTPRAREHYLHKAGVRRTEHRVRPGALAATRNGCFQSLHCPRRTRAVSHLLPAPHSRPSHA